MPVVSNTSEAAIEELREKAGFRIAEDLSEEVLRRAARRKK